MEKTKFKSVKRSHKNINISFSALTQSTLLCGITMGGHQGKVAVLVTDDKLIHFDVLEKLFTTIKTV